MAPEVIDCGFREAGSTYDSRIDVWALGITAIELGDGEAPYQDMHPTRTLFQIVRNPPPRLHRPAIWSQDYDDFITECLIKNPEHRPHIMELLEHPFITGVPQNDFHLSTELKVLRQEFACKGKSTRRTEVAVRNGCLKTGLSPTEEVLHMEDLATMDKLNEDIILTELHERLKQGHCHTFVGDVLLVLTPNEQQPPYSDEFRAKYKFKSRSDNAPHIFVVADQAYQDMLHHKEPQHILLAGETCSGKTTNMLHLLQHLLYLGQGLDQIGDNVNKATSIIHALGNAATPSNPNSTRHVLLLELTFTATGKVSSSIFRLYQLEKWRVTYPEREQANFHIFYYFYDAMESSGHLKQYDLDSGRKYRYLRTEPLDSSSGNDFGVREDPTGNVEKFKELEQHLVHLGFQDNHLETLWNLIAAVLNLGEVRFSKKQEERAELENPEAAAKVARLLKVDEQKFSWALINYCTIQEGTAVKLRHTKTEAEAARDALACGIYFRLVDWIVTFINHKFSFTRTVFSNSYSITLMDLFGFECFKKNGLEQLFINTLNEQLQCHYNQHIFVWEMQEQEAEEISVEMLHYYDNKPTVDELMAKPEGLFHLLDEASKTSQGSDFILGLLDSSRKSSKLKLLGDEHEFSIAHCTGKVSYDARDMAGKNQDFLSPEMVDTMRSSSDMVVKYLFTNQLSRTGNLIMSAEACGVISNTNKERWGAALIAGNTCRAQKLLTESQGQFSQTRQMQTAAATYRALSLEILRGAGSSGAHFVRCIRTDLIGQPRGFHHEIVRQQLRALAVLDTAQARQKGYSHRIPFAEFICRYKFLAFDFDETVDVTKDNSRLLLVRLKMEGWVIGKSKVFLKYYHVEYLARLYETQVKKIIKVQSMMRAFLAKRNITANKLKLCKNSGKQDSTTAEVSSHS